MVDVMNLASDISSLINNIQEGSLLTLRATNLLARTVTVFTDESGIHPRKGYDWGEMSFAAAAEGEAVTHQEFNKDLRVTLIPSRYSASLFYSDMRQRTDWENYRDNAVMEFGGAAAESIDIAIAANFPSLTGGTVGSAGGTLSWTNIVQAVAKMRQAKIPQPYYVAMGEGQWYHLLNSVINNAAAFQYASDEIGSLIRNYYITPLLGGVVFVTTPNITGGAGTAATAAIYSPLAMAYDERQQFTIEPARNANRQGWELNANMWYDTGVWAANRGIQLIGTDVIP